MLLLSKLNEYKTLVNYDSDIAVRETLQYPYDFKKAVTYAVRKIAKEVRIAEKRIYVPIVNNLAYGDIILSNLTKDKYEYNNIISLALVGYNSDTSESYIKPLDDAKLGDVHDNTYNYRNYDYMSMFDIYKLALKQLGSKLSFNTTNYLETAEQGYFRTASNIATGFVTLNSVSNVNVGNLIFNLDRADYNEYSYVTITDINALICTVTGDVSKWAATDKLYVCSSLATFVSILFTAIPSETYFETNTEIPVPDKFTDELEAFVAKYLYRILSVRNPKKFGGTYTALLNTKMILTEEAAITRLKSLNKISNNKPYLYQPYSNG